MCSALWKFGLEHKSNPDAGTPLQIGNYVIGILRNHKRLKGRDNPRVPPLVIPIVVYHGRARWSVPRSARSLAHSAGDPFRYHLLDLGRIPYAKLSSDAFLRGVFGLLKYATVKDPPKGDLVEALRTLRSLNDLPVKYMMTNYELPRETLEQLVRDADPELWEKVMPTVAEAWKEEGKAEGLMQGLTQGKAEGKAEGLMQGLMQGKAETLLRQLKRRFDTVPEDARARVLAAPAEDLDAWLDAILAASSLDEVFRNESIH